MPSDLDLMKQHVRALFTHDERGRLRLVNEPGGTQAARFFLGRTAEGNIWRFRFDLPESLAEQLEALCLAEPTPCALRQEPARLAEYLRLLETDSPVQNFWTGPAYVFPDQAIQPSREAVMVTGENASVLNGGFDEWLSDVQHRCPFLAVLHEGRAVSVCCSVRITSEAHEAGVETLKGYRGRGYATDVVAHWGAEVRRMGCTPLYSTSWENASSQRVAQRLGLRQYGVTLHVA